MGADNKLARRVYVASSFEEHFQDLECPRCGLGFMNRGILVGHLRCEHGVSRPVAREIASQATAVRRQRSEPEYFDAGYLEPAEAA